MSPSRASVSNYRRPGISLRRCYSAKISESCASRRSRLARAKHSTSGYHHFATALAAGAHIRASRAPRAQRLLPAGFPGRLPAPAPQVQPPRRRRAPPPRGRRYPLQHEAMTANWRRLHAHGRPAQGQTSGGGRGPVRRICRQACTTRRRGHNSAHSHARPATSDKWAGAPGAREHAPTMSRCGPADGVASRLPPCRRPAPPPVTRSSCGRAVSSWSRNGRAVSFCTFVPFANRPVKSAPAIYKSRFSPGFSLLQTVTEATHIVAPAL